MYSATLWWCAGKKICEHIYLYFVCVIRHTSDTRCYAVHLILRIWERCGLCKLKSNNMIHYYTSTAVKYTDASISTTINTLINTAFKHIIREKNGQEREYF